MELLQIIYSKIFRCRSAPAGIGQAVDVCRHRSTRWRQRRGVEPPGAVPTVPLPSRRGRSLRCCWCPVCLRPSILRLVIVTKVHPPPHRRARIPPHCSLQLLGADALSRPRHRLPDLGILAGICHSKLDLHWHPCCRHQNPGIAAVDKGMELNPGPGAHTYTGPAVLRAEGLFCRGFRRM